MNRTIKRKKSHITNDVIQQSFGFTSDQINNNNLLLSNYGELSGILYVILFY